MNMLQFLFGRAVRARRPRAEILSPPVGQPTSRTDGKPVAKRKAAMEGLSPMLYVLASFLLGATQVRADVLAGWALTSNGTGTNLANVSAGTFDKGSSINEITYGANGGYATGWTTAGSVNANDYFTVTVAPASGYTLSITNLSFGERRSKTGIRAYEVRCSTNSFSTYSVVTSGTPPDNDSERSVSATFSTNVASGTTLEFRFYGYSSEAEEGTWRINDGTLKIQGTVSSAASAPTVSSTAAGSIAATSATLGGNVTADGGDTVTNRGVCYKTSASVTISDNKTQIGSGTGAFSNTVSSLSVNVHYYFRAYAQNSAGTSLGSESNFWTLANVPSAPTVAAVSSSSVSVDVNVNGNPSGTEFAIQETTSGNYVQADGTLGASAVWATDATWGTKGVTGLNANQQYTFQVKARNGTGGTPGTETSFSGTASKYTLANVPSAPTVANPTSSSLDITVNANGNPGTTQFAIQRTSDNQYLQSDGSWGASAVWATAATWGTKTATGLSPSTTYYFRVKARNGANTETAFSSTGSGTTSASGCASRSTVLNNRGTPVYTYYLGDLLAYIFYFEINVDTWGWTTDYGLGTTADGSGWTWRSAEYDSNNGTNWKWKSKASEHQFTSVGNWYYAGRFVNGGCTYYADVDWESTTGGGLSAGSYFTVSALTAPSSCTAVKDTSGNTATRVDLGWAQGGGKNVLITRAPATPTGGPTQGTGYSANDTFGNQTVIAGSQAGTSLEVTGLTPGATYYFTFYSENNSYYSTAVTASAVTLNMPQARNTSGSASPGAPAGTIYLGDTGKVFTFESWGTVETAWGQGRLWLRQGNADLSGGTAGAWGGMTDQNGKSVTSGVFNATGTWYWGIQMDYGATYGTNFWYKASSASWVNLAANGTGAGLTVTVSAIGDPGSQTATVASTTQINLSWAKNAVGHNVMVVRSTDSSFTAPTQGTAYTAGSSTIGGDLVIYNGNGTSYNDTGRTQGTMYYYKFYSVNNDYYSAGVTANATTWTLPTVSTTSATPGTPADPTQANATGNVTAEGGQSVTERGIVWNTTGAPTTANTKVAHASGGTGSFTVTLTSLTPGQKIYYRAYAINSVGTAYGSTLDFTADCFTNGPGILAASAVTATNFTANWSAVAGASAYQLDVSTNAVFGGSGGGSTTNLWEDFVSFTSNEGTDISSSLDSYTRVTGWTGDRVYSASGGGQSKLGAKAGKGYLTTPTIDLSSNSGDAYVLFDAASWSGDGATLQIYHASDGSTFSQVGSDISLTESMTTYSNNITGGTANSKIQFSAKIASKCRIYLDEVYVMQGGGSAPSFVPGYSNLTVSAGTSQSVTGLTSDVKYFYRVRAVNDYCTSTNSATTNVTTVAATANVVLGDNGTQVVAATVAAGTTAHILHRFQLGVTVANATLTNVSFTTAGSYAAADITKLQVWYSADDSLNTGTDTKLGSDITTGLGPGSHGITGLSQAINVGDTGYIFITADIAASPTYGKTINVAAITTGDVGFTAATKSGSTTAGGVQTLVAAEPTLHASALLFPSVGSDQLGVSWTSGNGDKRIVVVTEYDAAGLWLLNEGTGTTAANSATELNDAALVNGPTWTTRTGGYGAVDLDGTDDYLEVATGHGLLSPDITVSMWIYRHSEAAITSFASSRGNYYDGFFLFALASGNLNFDWGDGTAQWRWDTGYRPPLNQWIHIVVTRNSSGRTLYVNGNYQSSTGNAGGPPTANTKLRFGADTYANQFYHDGLISEPMILDYALTATQVSNLYAMGSMATGWVPTDGTAPSGVDNDFSAATDQGFHSKIVYDGTGTNVTVTGLKPDTAYRVRVYEYNGAGACVNYLTDGTPASAVQPTACPAAPTGLFANPTNTYDFTANWSASTGARGYIIDVSTTNTFGGTGGLTLIDEDFVSFPDWTDNGTSSDTTATHYGAGSPCRALADGSTLISPAVDYPTQLVFYVDASGTGNGKKTTNYYSLDGTTWLPISTFTVTDAGATLVNDLTTSPNLANATNVQFKFVGVTTWYLDDVKVTGGLVGSYVPGYEHRPVSGTSVSVTGLEDSVTYYWRVAATGARCTGDYSVVTNVTTIAGPPPIPPNVNATDGTDLNQVVVTWTDLNNKEQNFLVWRSTSSDSNTAAVIATLAANTVSYNDTTAGLGTCYWYWVMSSNAMGASALSVSNSGFRKLPTVQNVQATDGTSVDYTTITWTDSDAGETGYGIWYSTTANSGSATWLANVTADVATYNHEGTPGQQYYYWVRATNSTLVTQSDLQATGEPGYRKLATVAVSASDGTDTSKVVVNWTDIAGETGYSVWRSETDDSGTAEWLANVAADGNVLSEDFEDAWAEAPSGWSREIVSGTTEWIRDSGGHSGYPAAAHGGTYNALFYSGSSRGSTNRLITPSMDLSGFSGANVDFWHAQAVWSTDQDILRVLYRTSSVASWVQLAEYTTDISSWTERNLSLPNLSADYYVAFEAVGDYGYGVVLDDVAVTGLVSSVTNYYDEEAVAGTQYYYWVMGTNASSGCQSDAGIGDGGWRRLVENPSSVELTRDGREMVRAAITANANSDTILVLHSTLAEVSGIPALNSSYTVGATLGNAKVIYKGAAPDFREHVVSANTTNHYRVFSVLSNIFYSSGTIPTGSPVETKPYQPNVVVETFSYTNVTLNTDSFTNKGGGANWASGSNWVLSTDGVSSWLVLPDDSFDDRPIFSTAPSNQATLSGNRAFINLDGANRWGTATRSISTVSTGTVFVSALMAYRYEAGNEGADRWLTIAMMNGSTEEVEFGKVWGANRTFTIRHGGNNTNSSYALNPYGDSTNNWYWVVLKYDFDNDTARAAAFWRGEGIPSSEPSTWDVEWSSMSIPQVTGLRLKAGNNDNWLGGALFDEVRVSKVWPALLGEPVLVITPESKNFGDVEVDRPDIQTFWVQNIGGDKVPLTVSSLTLGGANPTNFFLSTSTLGTIEYGQSNSFTVTFRPNVADQDFSATLYLTNSSGVNPVIVPLSGHGVPSQLTNAPAIDEYEVGVTNQVTDGMVTSGVFSVVLKAYHPAGIATAKYSLLNSSSTVILANQTFESWASADGMNFVFSNATHAGYWPGTPGNDYLVEAVLISSNGYGITNTSYNLAGGVESTDLFISEYIEGLSNNKAVEIYNGTGASVDLSGYTLRIYVNGGTSPKSITLNGTLAAGEVYVVAHSSANAAILAKAHQTSGSLDFNGNDVVALAKSGSNIDVVGNIGDSTNFAKDVTKVRSSSVTDGTTTYTTGQWTNYPVDTTTYLGAHTMEGGGGTPMRFQVIDDDTEPPVISNPLVNGTTTPAGTASGPSIAIGDVPAGGFGLAWNIQDTGSGVFAASNHYTLKRSNTVIAAGAVPTGANGDGRSSALAVSTTIPKSSMIWGNYVLSLAGADYDPEWVGDVSSVSNMYYFVIEAPNISLQPTSLDYGTVERDTTSNLTVVVSNNGNADLVVSGIGFSGTGSGFFSVASPAMPLTVPAGESANVVVSFTPTVGGTFNVTMTLTNNTPNAAEATVSIVGECHDPETAPPSIYDYGVVDAEGMTREVTDHALAHGGVTLNFTLWHYTGIDPASVTYDLVDPFGNVVWTNGTFGTVTESLLNNKTCQVFTAAVPDIYPAVTGVYTARVTAVSSNGYGVTDQATYTPSTAGAGVPFVLDRFSRPDVSDDIGEGWATNNTGPTAGNIQLRDHALQFYGVGGTSGDGRLSVVRDMAGRYNTVLANNSGTLTWAFNFFSGQDNMTGLGSGKYAGLFVLGATSTNFVGGSGDGYAVRICSNQVALVKFTGGLNADGDATVIGMPANLAANTPMGVRVDMDPATGAWTLYTTNWGGDSAASFGDPLTAAELATSTVDSTHLGTKNLRYVGCYWNHGSGTPGPIYGATFDDVHAPYVMPTAPLMTFLVYDEDLTGPVHSGFNVNGRQYPQAAIYPGGLNVTGLVADANGVYAGASNVWTLISNGMVVTSGAMTMTPNTDGAGTFESPAALSANIAFSYLDTTNGIFTFRIVSTDYDTDRPGDFLSVTNEYTFYITDEEAPTPLNVTAVADGMEMVVLTWERGVAQEVVVLWSTNPITANALVPGQTYNQNDDGPAGTKVIYRGTNTYVVSGTVTNGTHTEVVVPEGSVNYFRVFGANGTVYSSEYGEPAGPATTLKYEDGEIVDQFAYTNNVLLMANGPATGQGWSGGWFGDSNSVLMIDDTNLLHGITMYPDPYANKLQWVANSQVKTNVEVTRKLAVQRSGRTFIAFMMNYKVSCNDDQLNNKYVGLSLMSGAEADEEEIFFGKLHGHDKDAGIYVPGTGEYVSHTPNYALEGKHFSDYMIVGEWDPAIKTIRMWAFYQGDTNAIPQEYTNAPWIAAFSNDTFNIGTITGIRLAAGMTADDTNSLDHVYFDEVRVGGTWDEVLNFNYPKAMNFRAGVVINGTNYVSDGQLSEIGKSWPISYTLYHRTGVTNASFNIITNVTSTNGLYTPALNLLLDPADADPTDKYRDFTNLVTKRVDTNLVTLGVYTSRVWMTAVSGKATNTLYMEGMAGATDLFFGEFGEGRRWDKYVEIYNGTGGSVNLGDYMMAMKRNSYTAPWEQWYRLPATNLDHGKTILILNGEKENRTNPDATLGEMTNALIAAGIPYIITTNNVLQVSGDDPVGLFKLPDTNNWIDMCGIAYGSSTNGRYIMRRLEDAEVPRFAPEVVDTNQWDYRDWAAGTVVDAPAYTNFLTTAGVYDRDVGLGGYITFTVEDDDAEPPRMGPDSALMVGTTAPYTSLAPSGGLIEVVLTAWNFGGTTVEEGSRPWVNSLLTNATITWSQAYTPELVDFADGGTSENGLFDGYQQPNKGALEMTSIGAYFTQAEAAWIQFEMELTSAEDMVLSWAEASGPAGFKTAQAWWSSDGVNFKTNALWPSWNPLTGGATTYATRYVEFDGVVTPGLAKVYIRIVLGPGYGTAAGTYRMDNVQLNGYPQEFQVTDGQIAASGNMMQFQANLFDTNSGLDKAQATMALQGVSGTRDAGKDIGDGSTTDSTLWWKLALSREAITTYVTSSLSGKGLTINVKVPDADADRPNDAAWLDGRIGQVRVIDDDADRPKLTLTSMKPLSSILAQWAQMTEKISLMPTKSDAGVEVEALKTKSGTDDPKNPNFSIVTTNGYYIIEAFAWQGQNKCWLIEVTPEADMSLTNLTFTSYMHRTNGVSNYRIDHYVDGAFKNNILAPTYWVNPSDGFLDPNAWYTKSHGWTPGTVVLEAGKVNQIRIYGLGSSNIGARWRISDLTLWQAATDTDGVTEVTDAEFTSGSFKLTGNAWDPDSGIASVTNTTASKRPMFSLNAPDGGVFVTNQLFQFASPVADGGATTKEAGAFDCPLPKPVYTNVMLGAYTGEAHVWDHDHDRTDDDLLLRGDLAMYVVDNDVGVPSTVGVVRVNGEIVPETAPTRHNVAWTNQPEFIVSFDSAAVDRDPGAGYSAKQRAVTGIGEYRVATDANINTLTPSNRATLGRPYPVATTEGALANYGFEMPLQGWATDANCTYQSLADDPDLVREGMYSLKQNSGGVASQVFKFRNTAGTVPKIAVSGWYRSAPGATFRVEAFTTNDLVTPVATRNLSLASAGAWSTFQIDPAEDLGNGQVEVIKVSLVNGAGGATYWDNIRFSVDIGDNKPSMRFLAGTENQGVSNPQYVYAVDADNNRLGDRLAGEAKPFYIAYDVTPPTQIRMYSAGAGATTETVDDPTTQFDLRWYTSYGGRNVGPDDPDNANHPTKVATDTDYLSPWMTYKIYFGTYNTLDVPEDDSPYNEDKGFVYTNYIKNKAYLAWSNVTAFSAIEDQSTTLTNYSALTNMTQGGSTYSNRLYDLDFDQDYIVIVVGVDKAGNEGPAGIYSWATNNTIKFALTRGWKMPKASALAAFPGAPSLGDTNRLSAMGIAWTAAGPTNEWGQYTMVTKDYDMIYWDSTGFRDSSNNVWQLVGTVNSNWYADDGGQARARGNIRFYRASYKDRWRKELQVGGQTVKQRPLASEEVYAMHNVILSGGQNFVALHGVPYSNSFAAVFGDTNTFPGGTSASPGSGATVVEFYSPGTNALTSEQYWLNTAGEWWRAGGIEVTHTVLTNRNFFTRGFSIHLPSPLPEAYVTTNAFDSRMYRDEEQQRIPVPAMVWSPILQVPTNDFSQTIYTGETVGRVKTCVYNLTALRLPVAAHPSQMRLLECGFVRAGNYADGDLIYTINTSTKDVLSGRGIWCDTNSVWRFADKNSGVVPGGYFKPNDVIIIVSRNKVGNGSWLWTYSPTHFYTLPTRWMGN